MDAGPSMNLSEIEALPLLESDDSTRILSHRSRACPLLSLPRELIDNIVLHVFSEDLSNLSQTCKFLRPPTLAYMYRDIKMTWKATYRSWKRPPKEITLLAGGNENETVHGPRIDLLLRSILEAPELAALIHTVDLRCEGHTTPTFRVVHSESAKKTSFNPPWGIWAPTLPPPSESTAELFVSALHRLNVPREQHFEDALRDNDSDAVIALFLVLCPRLSVLNASKGFFRYPFLRSLLLHLLSRSEGIKPFENLRCINLGAHVPMGLSPTGLLDYPYQDGQGLLYTSLLYLPHLEEIKIENSPMRFPERSLSSEPPANFLPPMSSQPAESRLRKLQLSQANFTPDALQELLSLTPHLQTFSYDSGRQQLEATLLSSVLKTVQKSLTDLTIAYDYYSVSLQDRKFPCVLGHCSLQSLHVLRKADVPLGFLLGLDPEKAPRLSEVLPASLVSLSLGEDNRQFEPVPWNEDRMMQCFTEFVENYGWKIATPNLKEFNVALAEIDVRKFGYMEEDGWEPNKTEEDLRALCQRNGLSCEMLRWLPEPREGAEYVGKRYGGVGVYRIRFPITD